MHQRELVLAVIILGTMAVFVEPGEVELFSETTEAAGISSVHQAVPTSYLAVGQAWGDYDDDGWVDLYVTDAGGSNTLYRNNGNGTFSVSPLSPAVALAESNSGGAVFGDFDNDGWLDLYVAAEGANTLFRNLGGTGFLDVTALAGVGDALEGESAAWGDYDGDGWLDLYVTNWGSEDLPESQDVLYHNDGDGTFSDTTALLGFSRTRGPGFAAAFLDYDNDGDSDLVVINDKFYGNLLWRNDGAGCGGWCFTDVSVAAGVHRPVDGMGIAIADFDGDLDLDMYFPSIGEMVLLRNDLDLGTPVFTEVSIPSGVTFNAIGWAGFFFDFDNDGWLDLYQPTMNSDPQAANRLVRNAGDGTFIDVTASSGAADPSPTLGSAMADYDHDGSVDFVIGNRNQDYRLYRNMDTWGASNNWVAVELVGGGSVNRNALGTRVGLSTSGGRTLMQELKSGSSFGAGNEIVLHFGLGGDTVDGVTIEWPDGLVEHPAPGPLNHRWRITHPQAVEVFRDRFDSGDLMLWSIVQGS